MGDLPRWKKKSKSLKSGLIVMGDLPRKDGLTVMGDLPRWKKFEEFWKWSHCNGIFIGSKDI
jgi:hypothetical protein